MKKMLNFSNQFALAIRGSPRGSSLYNLFPINTRVKYPVPWDRLLERVNNLIVTNGLTNIYKVYQDCDKSEKDIKKDLKGLAGIYLWFNKTTGKFYVGSAKSLAGSKDSRLLDYFQKGRLEGDNQRVSKDIASDMIKYSKNNWNLIILEVIGKSNVVTQEMLFPREQFWMLLLPTYNRSLVVGTHSGEPMSEENRILRSNLVYRYTVENDKIVPNSEFIFFGVKETSRQENIYLFDLQTHIKSGKVLNNSISLVRGEAPYVVNDPVLRLGAIYRLEPLTNLEQVNWVNPFKLKIVLNVSKTKEIWVYDANTNAFLEKFNSVKAAREYYNIPKNSINRYLNHKLPFDNKIFSRTKLH